MSNKGLDKLINQMIGKNMRSIRLARKMSQSDIARILDMSFQQIQKYESGVNRIAASNLFLLSQRLRVPVDYFFDGIAIYLEGEKK